MRIHAALMTQNELYDLSRNLQALRPFVDTITVVDGGSTDGSIPYMRNWSRQDSAVRMFIHPWKDDFPAQRNNYLRRVSEVAAEGDWLLVFDPDEYVEEIGLHPFVEAAERHSCGRIGFRCRSVSLRGEDRVWHNEDHFWKNLLVKWSPALRYGHHGEGPVHEDLFGAGGEIRSGTVSWLPELVYEHRKQEDVIWMRGVRNYFCGGGGPNLGRSNPRWVEMRQIANGLGIDTWARMNAYLLAGNIDERLKGWIVQYRQEHGWDGSSEQREWYKTYFRLYHPEEEPVDLRGEHIP